MEISKQEQMELAGLDEKHIEYNFPPTTFVESNTFEEQLDHLRSEVDEAGCELIFDRQRTFFMECIDAYHSAETLLRKLVAEHGEEKVLKAMELVAKKNTDRGYYSGCHAEAKVPEGQSQA